MGFCETVFHHHLDISRHRITLFSQTLPAFQLPLGTTTSCSRSRTGELPALYLASRACNAGTCHYRAFTFIPHPPPSTSHRGTSYSIHVAGERVTA